MTLTITDRMMRSAYTRHTATAWPVLPGEPTLWTVTWLPGRNLTHDQAQAAMGIAEAVGRIPPDAGPEAWTASLWEHLDSSGSRPRPQRPERRRPGDRPGA